MNDKNKTGIEFRFGGSAAWVPSGLVGAVDGGASDVPVRGIDTIAGLLNTSRTLAEDLLLSLSGSVGAIVQKFEVAAPGDTRFQDFKDVYFDPNFPDRGAGRITDWRQNEVNLFIKDDWRMSPTFTLNLGLRYDLMQVPYVLSGSGQHMTPGYLGGSQAILTPVDAGLLTQSCLTNWGCP